MVKLSPQTLKGQKRNQPPLRQRTLKLVGSQSQAQLDHKGTLVPFKTAFKVTHSLRTLALQNSNLSCERPNKSPMFVGKTKHTIGV